MPLPSASPGCAERGRDADADCQRPAELQPQAAARLGGENVTSK